MNSDDGFDARIASERGGHGTRYFFFIMFEVSYRSEWEAPVRYLLQGKVSLTTWRDFLRIPQGKLSLGLRSSPLHFWIPAKEHNRLSTLANVSCSGFPETLADSTLASWTHRDSMYCSCDLRCQLSDAPVVQTIS